jgi:hypothetical protein
MARLIAHSGSWCKSFLNAWVTITLGDGNSLLFWIDTWFDGEALESLVPDLVAAVLGRCRSSRLVASALLDNACHRNISGALTVPVLAQFLHLHQLLEMVALQPRISDTLTWRWCSSGTYSAASAYKALILGQAAVLGAKELLKAWAPNKCRFFVWLVLLGRCWTSARHQKHGLQSDGSCALCCQDLEICDHLLVGCSFSREVWFNSLRRWGWGLQLLTPEAGDTFTEWCLRSRKRLPKCRRKAFDSFVILVAWIQPRGVV